MKTLSRFILPLLSVACASTASGQTATPASWPSAGNGVLNTRANLRETTITSANASGLAELWKFKTSGEVPDTPTIDGGSAYAVDAGGSVYRLDAATGAVVWHIRLPSLTGNAQSNARTSPAIGPSSIIIGDQASGTVYALDKTDGALIWRSTIETAKYAIITSSPVIHGDRVVVGVASNQEEMASTVKGFVPTFRGSVVALDILTGKILWQTYMVPSGYTGAAVWGSNLAVDAARDAVFAGTGDNYSVPPAVASCQAAAQTSGQLDTCLAPDDHIDSVLSLSLDTGAVNWSRRMTVLDTWTVSCLPSAHAPATPCPKPAGLDYDFGSGPNLFKVSTSNGVTDVVGAGQKSGIYWALNRDTGATVWATQVNPGGTRGGIQWGSAVGGNRVFVAASNSNYVWSSLLGSKQLTNGGFWSALDASNGRILWQTATTAKQPPIASKSSRTQKPPAGASARAEGAVTLAGDVMYGADAAGNFVALNATTGAQVWTYPTSGAAIDGPSVVNGVVYWGNGYGNIGRSGNTIFAFSIPK